MHLYLCNAQLAAASVPAFGIIRANLSGKACPLMCPYNGPKQLLLAYQGGYKDQNGADKKGFLLLLILGLSPTIGL